MPVGRIVLKSISGSKKLSKLKTDGARLLYTWLLCHLDVNGCFSGDPIVINGQVLSRLNKTLDTVQGYLTDLEENRLIILYSANGDDFLFVPDFVEKQPHLRPDHEGKTTIPVPTTEQLRTNSVVTPAEVKLIKVKLSKVNSDFFNQFWKAYPYKKSKGQAEKAWKKINPDEELLSKMLLKIEKAKKSKEWLKDNGEYIPHPATWLNAKGWEDEDVEVTGGQTQGTRMACKKCGDSGQYAGIDESGLCTNCRMK